MILDTAFMFHNTYHVSWYVSCFLIRVMFLDLCSNNCVTYHISLYVSCFLLRVSWFLLSISFFLICIVILDTYHLSWDGIKKYDMYHVSWYVSCFLIHISIIVIRIMFLNTYHDFRHAHHDLLYVSRIMIHSISRKHYMF